MVNGAALTVRHGLLCLDMAKIISTSRWPPRNKAQRRIRAARNAHVLRLTSRKTAEVHELQATKEMSQYSWLSAHQQPLPSSPLCQPDRGKFPSVIWKETSERNLTEQHAVVHTCREGEGIERARHFPANHGIGFSHP
jgi:hypothetical protein